MTGTGILHSSSRASISGRRRQRDQEHEGHLAQGRQSLRRMLIRGVVRRFCRKCCIVVAQELEQGPSILSEIERKTGHRLTPKPPPMMMTFMLITVGYLNKLQTWLD